MMSQPGLIYMTFATDVRIAVSICIFNQLILICSHLLIEVVHFCA